MPDSDNSPNNGAESPTEAPRQSLRDAAEAAWNEVVEDAPDDDDGSSEVDNSGQPRDEYGRFRSKGQDPGVAAAPEPPSPDDKINGTPAAGKPHPARASGEQRGPRQLERAGPPDISGVAATGAGIPAPPAF